MGIEDFAHPLREAPMSREDVESTLLEFLRREPFQPFVIDLADGRRLEIDDRCLAINGGGATFLTPGYLIEDFWFDDVQNIQPLVLTGAS
jgi:hypothetical protein